MTALARTHLIVGDFDEVAALMANARESGRLVRVHSAIELPDNQVEVIAEIREPEPERGRWWPWLRVAGWLAALAVAAGVVALVVWAVMALVVWAVMALVAVVMAAIAWIHAHLAGILLGLVALAVLLVWACSGTACAGLHCGGCRR